VPVIRGTATASHPSDLINHSGLNLSVVHCRKVGLAVTVICFCYQTSIEFLSREHFIHFARFADNRATDAIPLRVRGESISDLGLKKHFGLHIADLKDRDVTCLWSDPEPAGSVILRSSAKLSDEESKEHFEFWISNFEFE
jgi:hypothetical protein